MFDEERKRLAKLSSREREVLWLVCQGNDYEEIGKMLSIAVPTVKATMGNIYVRLELDQLKQAMRIKMIHQVYWPLQNEKKEAGQLLLEPQSENEKPVIEILEPVSEEVARMVDEDILAIVPCKVEPDSNSSGNTTYRVEPEPSYNGSINSGNRPGPGDIIEIRTQKPVNKKDIGKRIRNWLMIIVFLGLGLIACAAVAYIAFLQNRDQTQVGLELTKAVAQLTQVAEAQASQPTMAALPAQVIDQPAVEPTPEPIVLVVTATPPPAPAEPISPQAPTIPLPFSDNFDNGPASSWKVLTGNWITANGSYSVATNEDYETWLLTILDEPTWKNYRIKVSVDNPPIQLNYLGVFVRSSGGAEYLGFVIDHLSRTAWSMVKPNSFHPEPIAGFGEVDAPSKFVLDIEVSGNQFIGRINGAESQRISISGFDNGGIALGMFCDSSR